MFPTTAPVEQVRGTYPFGEVRGHQDRFAGRCPRLCFHSSTSRLGGEERRLPWDGHASRHRPGRRPASRDHRGGGCHLVDHSLLVPTIDTEAPGPTPSSSSALPERTAIAIRPLESTWRRASCSSTSP